MTLVGADELRSTLDRAGDELADLPGRRAAQAIADAARPPRRTGYLADHVVIADDNGVATLTYTAPYAGAINYGWAARHIVAQPFLDKAVDASADDVLDVYATEVGDILDNVRGK